MMCEEMVAMLNKLELHEPLSQREEALWLRKVLAYRCTKFKQWARSAVGVADYTRWPSKDWEPCAVLDVALILNRQDVLVALGYTMLYAIQSLDHGWMQSLFGIQSELIREGVVHLDEPHAGA